MPITIVNKCAVQRTPTEQVALAVRILDERHTADVSARMREALGERTNVVGRADMSRNVLSSSSHSRR